MAREVETVSKRGTGRRDWSKNTEQAVVGVTRSWQDRYQVWGNLTAYPGYYTTVSFTISGEDSSFFQYRIVAEDNKLIDTLLEVEDKGTVCRKLGYNEVTVDFPAGMFVEQGKKVTVYVIAYGNWPAQPSFKTRFYLSGVGRHYEL